MRRRGFAYATLALSILIIFAPRPWRGEAGARSDDDRTLLTSRVFTPSIDALKVREKTAQSVREPTLVIWLIGLGAVPWAIRSRRFPSSHSPSDALGILLVGSRGSRAPPPAVA
jgi:hypothetical protein